VVVVVVAAFFFSSEIAVTDDIEDGQRAISSIKKD